MQEQTPVSAKSEWTTPVLEEIAIADTAGGKRSSNKENPVFRTGGA